MNSWQGLPHRDGPDLTTVSLLATVQADEIVPIASTDQSLARHHDGMFTATQQVDLDQVRLAFKEFLLRGAV
jgi:hypothetical protein